MVVLGCTRCAGLLLFSAWCSHSFRVMCWATRVGWQCWGFFQWQKWLSFSGGSYRFTCQPTGPIPSTNAISNVTRALQVRKISLIGLPSRYKACHITCFSAWHSLLRGLGAYQGCRTSSATGYTRSHRGTSEVVARKVSTRSFKAAFAQRLQRSFRQELPCDRCVSALYLQNSVGKFFFLVSDLVCGEGPDVPGRFVRT